MIPLGEIVIFLTPKAYSRLELGHYIKNLEELGIEVCTTPMVYMNMSEGWTEEECDNAVYIMPKTNVESQTNGLNFKKSIS